MRERRANVEVAFGLMFTAIALIALLVAVCVGLRRMKRVLATMPRYPRCGRPLPRGWAAVRWRTCSGC